MCRSGAACDCRLLGWVFGGLEADFGAVGAVGVPAVGVAAGGVVVLVAGGVVAVAGDAAVGEGGGSAGRVGLGVVGVAVGGADAAAAVGAAGSLCHDDVAGGAPEEALCGGGLDGLSVAVDDHGADEPGDGGLEHLVGGDGCAGGGFAAPFGERNGGRVGGEVSGQHLQLGEVVGERAGVDDQVHHGWPAAGADGCAGGSTEDRHDRVGAALRVAAGEQRLAGQI